MKLKALEVFRCIGSDCPFNCCKSWEVRIEPQTLARWEGLEQSAFKQLLQESVERNVYEGQERVSLRMDNDQNCSFLDEAGLCRIYKETGSQDLMPQICRDYPRTNKQFHQRKLMSANLSCPEMARLVLSGNRSDLFDLSTDGFGNGGLTITPIEQIGKTLEEFVKLAMAEQRFPLAVRITGIAEVLMELVAISKQSEAQLTAIERMCAKPRQRLYDLNQKLKSRQIKSQAYVAGQFWSFLLKILGTDTALKSIDPLITQDSLVRCAVEAKEQADYEHLHNEIVGLRNKAVFELSAQCQSYGEKYLTVKFLNWGFPFNPVKGNYIASFLHCIFAYALIQLSLWIIAAHKEKLQDSDVLSTVYRVERLLDHSGFIISYLANNPSAMRLDLYYQSLADL